MHCGPPGQDISETHQHLALHAVAEHIEAGEHRDGTLVVIQQQLVLDQAVGSAKLTCQ